MVGDNSHILWTAGCVLGASGVAFGALGAHALRRLVTDPARLRSWETAAHYQLFHAIPLLMASSHPSLHLGGSLLLSGCVLFSGSIYALVLRPQWRLLGLATPLGGMLLISGWAALAMSRR